MGVLFAVYNGVAGLIAFLLPVIAKRTSRVSTHVVCLLIGGLSLISMYFFKEPKHLLLSMTGVGIAWAGILTMPYAIVTSALPYRKMGIYMGIFNFFIVIPQIVASAVLGFIVRTIFHGHAIYALVFGGGAMIVAAITMIFVTDRIKK